VFVVRDNIDTDQIIPAQYLNLVPTIAEEYEKLGSFALIGLPDSQYKTRFVEEGQLDSKYPIVVGSPNRPQHRRLRPRHRRSPTHCRRAHRSG
jgi:3-isopropylmalate/(R)-2-methylmalate dehydratase small subunit